MALSREQDNTTPPAAQPAHQPPKIIKRKKDKPDAVPEASQSGGIARRKVVVKKKTKIIIVKDRKPETGQPAAQQHAGTQPAAQPRPADGHAQAAPRPQQKIVLKNDTAARPAVGAGTPPAKPGAPTHGHGARSGGGGRQWDKRRDFVSSKDRDKAIQEQRILEKIARKKRQQESKMLSISKEIDILSTISVGDLAKKMNLRASDIISKLMTMGSMVRVNDLIDSDTATILASEYGCKVTVVSIADDTEIVAETDKSEDLVPRPPVVTIMGHVDHGKTSLLDKIRQTNVVAGESGGITQHIGAYKVKTATGGTVTFIDTPGHAAFTMMRSRGAKVTDIVVLVVAANDGVMPQTIEAINHAKAAKVQIIVAVNKIDLPDADLDKIKRQLSEHELIAEDWGGQTLFAYVSAMTGQGVDKLLETILLQSEIMELKANPKRAAVGTVLEASLDVGRGSVGTVLVQNGTLHVGDHFIAGTHEGRVRAMFDDRGERITEAPPSTPVEVLGFEDTPEAGDSLNVMSDEKEVRAMAERRRHLKQTESAKAVVKVTLDNLFDQIKEGEIAEFKVVIRADVQGSAEALKEALTKLSNEKLKFVCIQGAAGAINESDVMLAETSKAMIIAYRVRPSGKIKSLAEKLGVEIKKFDIIYEAIEFIEAAMKGSIAKEMREVDTGTIEVRSVFKISKIGTIAGCYVTSGKIDRNNGIRIIRDGVLIHKGKIASLKRFKDDVREVQQGFECGLSVENFNDLKELDVIEAYTIQEFAG
ncbi:MAG: translation initiation factor IF-2 [Spirochaetes bacterium]|nr:translation initiation factor IF-2 [Spirochaetota bacterium]